MMQITTFLLTLTAGLQVCNAAAVDTRQTDITTRPEWVSDSQFNATILTTHNQYRRQHQGARLNWGVDLTWDATLASAAKKYLDSKGTGKNQCPPFDHSGGQYGENLAIGYGTPTAAAKAWGDERAKYDFQEGVYFPATGHFTQMVWRDTQKIGCARKYCTSGASIKGWYLACEYFPRGNIIGRFKDGVKIGTYKPPKKT
ncbi:hypothetical protein BN1708_011191 [Verticillium longisporum]|uniref:SCP domain-containing protein n=2 Tax=Verticillium longisporum TaxID=100787 RepID=A0A0G4KY70_VERLO|nr:hypothetical protein BN1708_011191 [Verticillium longisporum]